MTDKATKKEANYRIGSADKRCALCTMFQPPDSCTAVKGDISEADLCDYFKRKRSWYGKKET